MSEEELWSEARPAGEALFAKLGLSQTNFSFHEELPSSGDRQVDSRREAVAPSAQQIKESLDERMAWNKKTLGDAYEAHGDKNSKWNTQARESLALFAQMRSVADRNTKSNVQMDQALRVAVKEAFDAQCPDPMIRYLHLRYYGVTEGDNKSPGRFTQEQMEIGKALELSHYPPIRKFYGALRSLNGFVRFAPATTTGRRAARVKCLELIERSLGHLRDVLEDPTTPHFEAFEATEEFLSAMMGPDDIRGAHFNVVHDLLLKHHAKSGLAAYFKGNFYIDMAWLARGNGFSDSVSPEGWTLFARRLDVASAALNEAWELNPSAPYVANRMLTVELGQGKGRPRMERWFRRAMQLDNSNYRAASSKLNYLEPKWYGTEEDLLAFGQECLKSEVWRGEIPYIAVHAHERAAFYRGDAKDNKYWKQPTVWNECQQAFEKLFQMNIQAEGYHHNYALIAYRCDQWQVFDREIKRMTYTNYTYFGGKFEFDSMVTNAAAKLQLSRR